MKPQPPQPPDADKERDALLKDFRAWLHLVITAKQIGQDKELKALPGPRMQDYCRALAELPPYMLAVELEAPVIAVLEQISKVSNICEGTLHRKDEKAVAMHATAKRILHEVDIALDRVVSNHIGLINRRALVTQYSDLLCDVIFHIAIGHRMNVAGLLRRYQQLNPEDGRNEDGSLAPGSFLEMFAQDVYHRVEALDKLADEFPDQMRFAAQRMHAWPMLMHRHTSNRRRFNQLADRLELGADYPVDASEGARFRPDTPLVRYLEPLIYRLHFMCWELGHMQFDSVKDEQFLLLQIWWDWPEEPPGERNTGTLASGAAIAAADQGDCGAVGGKSHRAVDSCHRCP